MLKQPRFAHPTYYHLSAAFGRLCVETVTMRGLKTFSGRQPPSGGCVLKRSLAMQTVRRVLQPPSGGCVLKRAHPPSRAGFPAQPPSGGCVLKRPHVSDCQSASTQPPSGGCVLKQSFEVACNYARDQPPSGGCVLKLWIISKMSSIANSAAFGRLCVETGGHDGQCGSICQPPSGGCVLKPSAKHFVSYLGLSRLRAAVC